MPFLTEIFFRQEKGYLVRNRYFMWLLLSFFLQSVFVPATWASQPHTAVVGTFETERNNGTPIVEVQFGDKTTGFFAIDTGAYDCVMTAEFAKQLGYKQERNSLYLQELLSGTGVISPTTIRVPSLKIDGLEVTHLQFQVSQSSLATLSRGRPLDGLLGGTFLSHFALMLDYPRHALTWIMPGDLENQTVVQLGFDPATVIDLKQELDPYTPEKINHYAVQAELTANGKPRKEMLWIDTGAPETSISRETAKRLSLSPTRTELVGLVQSSPDLVSVASIPTVKIEALTLTDVPVIYPIHQGFFLPSLLGENVLGYGIALFDFGPHRFYFNPVLPGLTAATPPPIDTSRIDWDRLRNAADLPEPLDILEAGLRPAAWEGTPQKLVRLRAAMTGGPEDAARYEDIGALLRAGKEDSAAQAAFAQAVMRRHAAALADPADPKKAADWVAALILADSDDEALASAQAFVIHFPTSFEAYCVLGLTQETHAARLLLGSALRIVPDDDDLSPYPLGETVPEKPTEAVGQQIEFLRHQARENFVRAVKLAPHQAEPYAQRASFWIIDRALLSLMHTLNMKGQTLSQETAFAAMLSDRQSQAQLSLTDPDILRRVALLDLALPLFHDRDWIRDHLHNTGQSVADGTLLTAEAAEAALTKLSQSDNKSVGVSALEALGAVQQAQDKPAAENTWRRALATDPIRMLALRGLAGKLLKEGRLTDLRDLLTSQMAHTDTLPLHFLLAATLTQLGQFEDAEAQVRVVLKTSPDNPFANLTLAGLLLARSGYDYGVLTEVSTCLDKARDGFGTQATQPQKSSLRTMQAVWLALAKDPAGARQQLIELAHDQPTCTQAREALAALTLPAP